MEVTSFSTIPTPTQENDGSKSSHIWGSFMDGERLEHVEIQTDKLHQCELLIHNTTLYEMNKLRRILMSQIHTMSIEYIEIERNSSVLPDETIVHRLGLLPIYCQNMDDVTVMEDCVCENESGCKDCSLPFVLNVTGRTKKRFEVTSDHIQFTRKNLKISTERIPIFFLRNGESVLIRGKIQKSTAKIHSKWSPVTSSIIICEVKKGTYRLSFEGIGQIENKELVRKALHVLRHH